MNGRASKKIFLSLIFGFSLITYLLFLNSNKILVSNKPDTSVSNELSEISINPEINLQNKTINKNELFDKKIPEHPFEDSKAVRHQVLEDVKRFTETYEEAIVSEDFKYAGDLLSHKACLNMPAIPFDPETEPNCMPLFRKKIAQENRIFMSDELANSYLTLESKSELRVKALEAIKTVNPDLYTLRKPCLEYYAADLPTIKNNLIEECLMTLKEIKEIGPLKTLFWIHFESMKKISRSNAEEFKSEMESKSPGISDRSPPAARN